MAKNIVICCDGTGNEIEANLSNVLKLFRVVRKNADQVVYYDPGVGTIGVRRYWSRMRTRMRGVWGLMTGQGLDDNVLDAYRFLIDTYEDGDRVYLFGFSRGAYTVRLLAGFLRTVGLLAPAQRNLCDYALTAYKQVAETGEFEIAWRFERIAATRQVPIRFLGVWDTVSSVIVPRPDRFYLPSFLTMPHTRTNPNVEVFRQAIAIDERRRMFRLNRWVEPQPFKPNRFARGDGEPQDIKQVWFAGVHSDIGGGYPETESGPAKFPLQWMIDEAVDHGLQISGTMYRHLVLGHPRRGGQREYTSPDFKAKLHNSMKPGWLVLEGLPKYAGWREWPRRWSLLWLYLPLCEPRRIEEGARVHRSVIDRLDADMGYKPVNLPPRDRIEIEEPRASADAPGDPAEPDAAG